MTVNKYKGKILGATLNKTERKALDMEIRRSCAEWDKNNALELEAIILLTLHREFGFGVDRLHQFYKAFGDGITELIQRYELDDTPEDKIWLAKDRLKTIGVDVEEWARKEG